MYFETSQELLARAELGGKLLGRATTVQQCSCCVFGDFHRDTFHPHSIRFISFHFLHCLFLLTITNTSNERN